MVLGDWRQDSRVLTLTQHHPEFTLERIFHGVPRKLIIARVLGPSALELHCRPIYIHASWNTTSNPPTGRTQLIHYCFYLLQTTNLLCNC